MTLNRRDFLMAGAALAATPAWATTGATETDRLNAFFETVFQRNLARDPGAQSGMGMKAGQDRWPDIGATHAAANVTQLRRDLAALKRFDRNALTPEGALSYRLFGYDAAETIERHRWRTNRYPVCQMRGPQRSIPQTLINNHPIADLADAEAYVARLHNVKPFLEQVVAELQAQAAAGVRPPAFPIRSSSAIASS